MDGEREDVEIRGKRVDLIRVSSGGEVEELPVRKFQGFHGQKPQPETFLLRDRYTHPEVRRAVQIRLFPDLRDKEIAAHNGSDVVGELVI